MKADLTTSMYKKLGYKEDHGNINQYVKAVVVNFHDGRGDIVVENDNFGTRRKYACFTEGKRKAGLHPMQIVFSGINMAHACHERYVGTDDCIHEF